MDELYDLPPAKKARALYERGRAERREGREAFAHGYYTQSLNLFRGHRDRQGMADALLELADLALHYNPTGQNGFERRKALCEEALGIYRELGDRRGTARALRLLASVAPHEEGSQLLEESLALAREEGDKKEIAASLRGLGVHLEMCEPLRARVLKEEALLLYRELGEPLGEAGVLFSLAISFMNEDAARSREFAEASLRAYRQAGSKRGVAQMLMFVAKDQPDDETRIAYHTECREICREIGVPIWEASSLRNLARIAEKRGEMARAQALRTEADQICPERPKDPKLLKAFKQALNKKDPDAARDAARRLF